MSDDELLPSASFPREDAREPAGDDPDHTLSLTGRRHPEPGPMTPEEIVRSVVEQSQTMTRPVYRGQADAHWMLESGAVRRLRGAYGEDLPTDEDELRNLVAEYHREQLIMPIQVIDGDSSLSDIQRLSVLQHHGAATGLLDFTENPLVALWFACKDWLENDARVFLLDIGDPRVARNSRTMGDLSAAEQFVVYYEPDRSLGARIIAQQSVFVIFNPPIPDRHLSVVVPKNAKKPLQAYLTRLGLSNTALFGDIPGLAAANTAHSPLQRVEPLTPEQHRRKGNRAYQAERYNDALAAYEAYEAALPDVAEPYCLKGDTLAALGRFADADLAYTKAIENLDQPIHLANGTVVNRELIDTMARTLYYNRGNAHAATDDHPGAVADFDLAIQYADGPKWDILHNRGNSKFALGKFVEAHKDFELAWLERQRSNAALAMGNCWVMTGEFESARQHYLRGTTSEPEEAAIHCRANAEQVLQILQALNGREFRIKRSAGFVLVEVHGWPSSRSPTVFRGSARFPFTGNPGNIGNIPSGMVTAHGGKGYKGGKGFVVDVVDATDESAVPHQ